MTTGEDIPDLFGRATIVFGGHEGLRETASGLRILCVELRTGKAEVTNGLRDRVDAFADDVLSHFAAEESDDYFGTLASESELLLQGITELKHQHAKLKEVILRLRDFQDLARRTVEFSEEFEQFLDHFAAHEKEESALLREFLRPAGK